MSFQKFVLIPFSEYNQVQQSGGESLVHYADFISPKYKTKGQQLLTLLQKIFVGVGENGEVVLKDRTILGSNFVDFLKYLMNKSPKESNIPIGIKEILTYLRQKNFPSSSFVNLHARKRLLEVHHSDSLDEASLPSNEALHQSPEVLHQSPKLAENQTASEKSDISREKTVSSEKKEEKKKKTKKKKPIWLEYM